jgi:hypothetical protein
MPTQVKTHLFPVSVRWVGGKVTCAAVDGMQELPVATPPEFNGGVEGVRSPEDLLVASAATCFTVTMVSAATASSERWAKRPYVRRKSPTGTSRFRAIGDPPDAVATLGEREVARLDRQPDDLRRLRRRVAPTGRAGAEHVKEAKAFDLRGAGDLLRGSVRQARQHTVRRATDDGACRSGAVPKGRREDRAAKDERPAKV